MPRKDNTRLAILLGVPFHDVTMGETLDRIDALIAARTPGYLATANLDFAAQASQDVELQRILFDAELVLCDGTPLVWASRWLGAPLRERVAGSDMMPHLFARAAERGHRLFFLGSSDEVLEEAARKCREQYPALNICGTYAPPYARLLEIDNTESFRRIREAKPDLLLVAMGCPKQEKWIYMNYRELGVPVSIGIGASLDFIAGKFRRAPVWMRVCGLEWVVRLMQEPKRLFTRYCFDFLFFARVLRHQRILLRERRTPPAPLEPAGSPAGVPTIIYWHGRVDAAAVESGAVQPITPQAGQRDLVLDCSGVEFMDSTGLGLFIRTFRLCKQMGTAFVLLNPSEPVRQLLSLLKMDRLIPVATNEQELITLLQRHTPGHVEHAAFDAGTETVTVALSGDVTVATVENCESLINSAWEQAPSARRLELDLREVAFIDSCGLGLLVKSLKLSQRRMQGSFVLLDPPANVRNVITLANLHTVMGVKAA